tara:strand:+ start:825 stop:2654 length:1830 start_codon:yes stop_codon:yes gene_type:complete
MYKFNPNKLGNFKKKIFLITSDFIIIIFSILASYSLRLEKIYSIFKIDIKVYLIFLTTFFLIFYVNNIYQILLRYFDYFSIQKVIKSIIYCLIILVPINFFFYEDFYFPRSISFIAPIIIGILIILHRVLINFLLNSNLRSKIVNKNILIIGIDNQIINLIKNIRGNLNSDMIKALIDTKNLHKKREFNGIKIYKKKDLDELIKNLKINEIIVSSKSLNDTEFINLFNKYENMNIRIKKLNKNEDDLNEYLNQSIISKLNFFNIINRPKIVVKKEILEKKIKNKSILITGGGGSIGSELCVEIIKHKPKKIYILEISEINLFNLINKIKEKKYNIKILKPVLGDCNDKFFLDNYFKDKKIDEVYHAAAYKHVGFGEENPYSMIRNNIFATKTMVNFSIKKKIKNFIFISSDKAVKPKSILGFTKRFGEKIIKYEHLKNKRSKTNFTIVRFGNVIGSSGSVIPIFLDQISKNLPLTVTHKKARRYFMSISEAVQLVINASSMNINDIKIYALNMGEQKSIYKIAERIIRLSGKTVENKKNLNGDIPIKIIGLKKGEKISEELTLGDNLKKTSHPEIMLCDEKINTLNLKKDLLKIENKSFKDMYNIKINY